MLGDDVGMLVLDGLDVPLAVGSVVGSTVRVAVGEGPPDVGVLAVGEAVGPMRVALGDAVAPPPCEVVVGAKNMVG